MAHEVHNVIVLGAGASVDAGIPTLPTFMDKMWEYAFRGKCGNEPIVKEDLATLQNAVKIRAELDSYNARANFDNRNLEDVLSLLSFEALRGEDHAGNYAKLVRAVGKTIELSCNVPYRTEVSPPFQLNVYHRLWQRLLAVQPRCNLALITFNYDLVFERSLWELFHGLEGAEPNPLPRSCRLDYHFRAKDFSLRQEPYEYLQRAGPQAAVTAIWRGYRAVFQPTEPAAEIKIPYLKLHGSLNWNQDQPDQPEPPPPTKSVDTPLILPPVFNKMKGGEVDGIWSKALEVLRTAKHIIIVGYSLPRTDIYMQYFLKSAVGPNSDLQRVVVYNPDLFKETNEAAEMEQRYRDCFAAPFSRRIVFRPHYGEWPAPGTLDHFLASLEAHYESPLFLL
jgi:hypothetical protein